jgi:D-glycero-D-manno-heptose 1,7-bisphosphate phosphatase
MSSHSHLPAVFIDRDGTINRDVGYLADPDELEIYPWSAEAIRLINDARMKTIVITNQSGVARGLCTEEALASIHERMKERLLSQGARIDAIYYCPHHPEIGEPPYRQLCDCRKPKPGLVNRAAREHDVDMASSYMIGDKVSDLELGTRAGARAVLVLTGYGRITLARLERLNVRPAFVCENLLEAANRIVQERRDQPGARL